MYLNFNYFGINNLWIFVCFADSRDKLQLESGILIAVPIPEMFKKDGQQAHSVIKRALQEAQ